MSLQSLQFLPTCCYHPTTVLMLDDSRDLLIDLSFALLSGVQKYKSKYSTSPQEIIEILYRQGNTIESFIKNYVSISDKHFDLSKTIVDIDIPLIHQEIYRKPVRFDQCVVLIVDYAMPDMNGLEVCKKIRRELQLPVKILMLTGEADQATAIEAFNEKLIDRFVVKSAVDYVKKLFTYIHELQTEYFSDISRLTVDSGHTSQKMLRKNPAFIQFFNEIAHRHHAVEYYMLEESGSFLFLDANKNVVRLIVKTDEDMQTLYEIVTDERNASEHTVNSLKKREKLVYFSDEKSALVSAKYWRLLDAKPLPGQEAIYYAIVNGIADYPLDNQQIVSYNEFINS